MIKLDSKTAILLLTENLEHTKEQLALYIGTKNVPEELSFIVDNIEDDIETLGFIVSELNHD